MRETYSETAMYVTTQVYMCDMCVLIATSATIIQQTYPSVTEQSDTPRSEDVEYNNACLLDLGATIN